jgi:CheY-like chemotaxis protein
MMVVDDTPAVLEYFATVTQGLKVKCDVVASGSEACKKIEANGSYDVYFIDWKMPGMNGIELTRKIKQHGTGQSVIVMISSAEWQCIEKEARSAGVDQFLQKPVFPSTIVDCLNNLVGLKGQNEQPKSIEGAFEGKWVLLAEDVKINREIVLVRLEPTKVKVDCAVNGKEALEKFISEPEKYAMILMDMQMPGMDGLEATAAIRALNTEAAKRIPIVAMTANVFREDIEKCIEAGMNDHIGKPLDFSIVMEKMRKYIVDK